jgi:DNA-binding beta-propeller fold protein YncE
VVHFRSRIAIALSLVAATFCVPVRAGAAAAIGVLRPPLAFVTVLGINGGPGDVVVVSPRDGRTVATIAVGPEPIAVAITPDAGAALVLDEGGYISVIDAASFVQRTTIPVCRLADAIAITPNGNTAVVGCPNDSSVELIDIATGHITSVALPFPPGAIAITPDGHTADVVLPTSSFSDPTGEVVPVSIQTGAVGTPLRLSGWIGDKAAFTPDGKRLLVSYDGNTQTGSAVDVIDTASGTISAVIPVPSIPTGLAVTADGTTAYVACWLIGNEVFPISLIGASLNPLLGVGTRDVAVTPDAKTLVSLNEFAGSIDSYDAQTLQFLGGTSVGLLRPWTVAITPDQAPQASLRLSHVHRKTVTLDASASFAPSTPITTYNWNFGDGTTAFTTTPTITHRYHRFGTYTATVTLTDAAGTSLQQAFTGQTVARNGGPSASARTLIHLSH